MDFVPFGSAGGSAFRWLRTNDDPLAFSLLSEDRPLASLAWRRPGGSLAVGATANGRWTFKRSGFLNPQVTARQEGRTADAARISVHLNFHRIDFAGGPSLRFHRAGVLVPAWQVTTDRGEELVHVEPVREGRKLAGGAVLTNDAALRRPELPLATLLSWYFIVLAWFEDEALIPLEGPGSPTGGA